MGHRAAVQVPRRDGRDRRPEHDPGRRRRRHAARAQGRRVREDRRGAHGRRRRPVRLRGVPGHPRHPAPRPRRGPAAVDPRGERHPRRHRGDHHRRPPALPAGRAGPAAVPGDQRQRLGHQEQVRQRLRHPALADRRHQPGHGRPHRRQGRGGLRLRRRRQGQRRRARRAGRPGDRHRGRPDLRAAGAAAGLPGRAARRRRGPRRHHHHHHRQQGHRHRRPHGPDEAPGDPGQRRPLRQRDRHGRAGPLPGHPPASTSSRRSTSGSSRTGTRSSCCPRAG